MYAVTAFYRFKRMDETEVSALRDELYALGKTHDLRGLVLVAEEGINGTVCGSTEAIDVWKESIVKHFGEMNWNDSDSDEQAFPRWYVKIRKEIVAIKRDEIKPEGAHKHLTPEEWNDMMEKEDVIVLDTRNEYETAIGTFEGAIDPKLQKFQDFVTYAKSASIPKDKKILMYCTGGIRCEKAIHAMEQNGYDNVYQLKGGILAYLKKFPRGKFKGECFVFDHRVAVDGELKPSSRYGLCPHCGDPADQLINCTECGVRAKICMPCKKKEERMTCSKRCKACVA